MKPLTSIERKRKEKRVFNNSNKSNNDFEKSFFVWEWEWDGWTKR